MQPPGHRDPASNALRQSNRGEVMLHPSPELLILLQPLRPPEFWPRCR